LRFLPPPSHHEISWYTTTARAGAPIGTYIVPIDHLTPPPRTTTAEYAALVLDSVGQPVGTVADSLVELLDVVARSGTDEQTLLREALDAVLALIPSDIAAVFEYDPGPQSLRCLATAGPRTAATAPSLSLVDQPVLRRALTAEQGCLLATSDVRDLGVALYGPDASLRDERSTLAAPLAVGDGPRGLLILDSDRPGVYPPTVPPVASLYGRLIGHGLSTRRRVDQMEQAQHQLAEYARLLEGDQATLPSRETGDAVRSPVMRDLLERAQQVAVSDAPVLILGETGAGKEVLARSIHRWSARADGPFVSLNCGALPGELIESELFGHVRGAFTGADRARRGRFAVADGGTLLLDEIGEMSPRLQVKLLRVLQEGTFQPVGSDRTVRVNVRVIAATHVDPTEAVESGRFREDLYYRLAVFPLRVPPLRERLEDLPGLVSALLDEASRRYGATWVVPPEGLALLETHDWPGNVRELQNTLERACIRRPRGGELEVELDPLRRRPRDGSGAWADWPTVEELERRYLRRVMTRTRGRVWGKGGAAELLKMPPTTLKSRLDRLGIHKDEF